MAKDCWSHPLLNPLKYTIKLDFLPSEHFKTGQITSSNGIERWFCYSNSSFMFLVFFIFTESLKNHNKSQKNNKIKNLILLEFTRIDLHGEYII